MGVGATLLGPLTRFASLLPAVRGGQAWLPKPLLSPVGGWCRRRSFIFFHMEMSEAGLIPRISRQRLLSSEIGRQRPQEACPEPTGRCCPVITVGFAFRERLGPEWLSRGVCGIVSSLSGKPVSLSVFFTVLTRMAFGLTPWDTVRLFLQRIPRAQHRERQSWVELSPRPRLPL